MVGFDWKSIFSSAEPAAVCTLRLSSSNSSRSLGMAPAARGPKLPNASAAAQRMESTLTFSLAEHGDRVCRRGLCEGSFRGDKAQRPGRRRAIANCGGPFHRDGLLHGRNQGGDSRMPRPARPRLSLLRRHPADELFPRNTSTRRATDCSGGTTLANAVVMSALTQPGGAATAVSRLRPRSLSFCSKTRNRPSSPLYRTRLGSSSTSARMR